MDDRAIAWLGLERRDDHLWSLPVTPAVMSGAHALFGGCATAAAVATASSVAAQPVVYASTHFGSLAKVGTTADVHASVIAAGRTLTHLEVRGEVDGSLSFLSRLTAGERPVQAIEGQWVFPPDVPSPDDAEPFVHPVHEGTWAERFEFRLAGTGDAQPWAAWWVRPAEDIDPLTAATVLVDYVTYGVGRALGVPMGGLSVDNVLRIHRPAVADWYLLQVLPGAIDAGLGHGSARLFADGVLAAAGSQSIVVNSWDWRLPAER